MWFASVNLRFRKMGRYDQIWAINTQSVDNDVGGVFTNKVLYSRDAFVPRRTDLNSL